MDFIIDAINEWIKTMLVDGIMGNLTGLFDTINSEVSRIAGQVGTTPSAWNGGVFSLIQNLSDTVIMPIAGMILTFIMCHELIQMIIEKNNMNDFPPSDVFKWIFKTVIAISIVTNTFPIIMAIFDVAQSVVSSAGGVILTDTTIGVDTLDSLETSLTAMDIGPLLGLFIQSFLFGLIMWVLSVCIFVIVYGRMLEIYLMVSLGAIPLATFGNKEWSSMGQNYIKSICALAFQGFLIMVCIGIYAVLIQSIATDGDPIGAIWTCIMYTVLLCFTLFKTGTMSKQIFNAH
ncbi:VirB6/TrbL-like conjugal transfer protein, CD1112 family [Chakrabartyella piscis]|uniref:VirB6/TrbL-like conjugal transfer protein, CD1112 family n=1 Tax=Chakrabartyella piscis TaxID=2918914 RepID=UPI0029589A77|nr:CD0415/CD1112 family protein [Chakrabartyella piscis]